VAEQITDDEKRWRHFPVLNRIFLWFVLTHARMNENPPVITWQAGPDRVDALLAEVMDPVFKYLWRDVGMAEVIDRLTSWMIPAGRVHTKSRIDFSKGDPIEARGPGQLELLNPQGAQILGADGQPIRRQLDNLPLGSDGQPLARLTGDASDPTTEFTGEPHVFNEGGLEVDVLTALECRGEWGEHIPWHKKAWHIHRSLLTPLQAWEAFGVELEPDVRGEAAENVGILWRMLHGSGLFGASEGKSRFDVGSSQEFVTVYELWQRPGRFPGTQKGPGQPGGRLTIATGSNVVVRDGQRNAPFRYTSPIRCYDFVNLPGRPSGSSPQEQINGPVRTRNRLAAQEIGHATQVANPVRIIDADSGIEEGQIPNIPGAEVVAHRSRSNNPPLEYVSPPPLGREVGDAKNALSMEIDQLGSIHGTEGSPPTEDASGELVKELRFNSDRPLAAPMKRMVTELSRMAEDWRVMVPLFWDQKKIIQISGDDGIARTLTVWPQIFVEGTVNAEPEVESMLPEGRGERQARMFRFWKEGVWGDPQAPEAINTFLELARFPHMNPATRPGGVDRSMAEQNVGKLLQGAPANTIPVFEWYDHGIHRMVLERFMKSPEFLKLDLPIQQEMVTFREVLIEAAQQAMLLEAERELMVQAPIQNAAMQLTAGGGGGGPGTPPADQTDPNAPVEGAPSSRNAEVA